VVNASCPSVCPSVFRWVGGRAAVAMVANGWPPGLAQYHALTARWPRNERCRFSTLLPPHASPTPHRHSRSRLLDGTRCSSRDPRCIYTYICALHTQRAPDGYYYKLRATTVVHRIDSAVTAPTVVVCALVAFPVMQSCIVIAILL